MAAKPKKAETIEDRVRIANAREVLQEFGQYVDVADMSDVAYEQRNCRMKAMDLATMHGFGKNSAEAVKIAAKFYDYIWEGKTSE